MSDNKPFNPEVINLKLLYIQNGLDEVKDTLKNNAKDYVGIKEFGDFKKEMAVSLAEKGAKYKVDILWGAFYGACGVIGLAIIYGIIDLLLKKTS